MSLNASKQYLRPEEVCKYLRLTPENLALWARKGKIQCIRTTGNHRRYPIDEIARLTGQTPPEKSKQKYCYCRVSTHSQKEDLERQVELLTLKFPNHKIIRDIGSGINFKRRGFNSLLDSAINGNVEEIVVTHRDRLCRFGFELIEKIVSTCSNGKIVVLDNQQTSPEKELVNDLLSIITVFSSRLYGLRSHSLRKKIREEASKNSENTVIPDSGGEETTTDNV
jgi:excisionase family DNA binding protein